MLVWDIYISPLLQIHHKTHEKKNMTYNWMKIKPVQYSRTARIRIKLLKPNGHAMHQHFNIQQLYVLPTLYLCVLYLQTATCATYSIN